MKTIQIASVVLFSCCLGAMAQAANLTGDKAVTAVKAITAEVNSGHRSAALTPAPMLIAADVSLNGQSSPAADLTEPGAAGHGAEHLQHPSLPDYLKTASAEGNRVPPLKVKDSTVPEPSMWSMLVVGLMLIGLAVHNDRDQKFNA